MSRQRALPFLPLPNTHQARLAYIRERLEGLAFRNQQRAMRRSRPKPKPGPKPVQQQLYEEESLCLAKPN